MGISFELQPLGPRSVVVIDDQLGSNAAAVILDDFILAIDATMRPDTVRTFRKLLEDTYQRPLRYACITHYHGDHTFGLQSWQDLALFAAPPLAENLRVRMTDDWTPQALAEWKAEENDTETWPEPLKLIFPSMAFHQQLDIRCNAQQVSFHHSGGHTSCSTYGYFVEEKTLFAGDLIFSGMFPYAGDRTVDPEAWMQVLRQWLNMEIETVVPGHGPITGKEEIEKHLRLFEELKQATLNALAAQKTPEEIILPSHYPTADAPAWLLEQTRERWYAYYQR